ncbi:MAG: Abi family protein [Pyrinomonadaceae bacterium]
MTVLSFVELESFFSAQRLQRYLIACGGNNARAIELYKANIRISQSFHPLLCLVETVLRNRINLKLSVHFNDPDWILNQRNGFMNHNTLGRRFYLKSEVDKTINRLQSAGYVVNSGKVIADLNFGFWSAIFERRAYQLLQGKPIQIFTQLPATKRRIDIYNNLSQIRDFRNRISHNEPICFNGNIISFNHTVQTYKIIYRTIRWIDSKLLAFFNEFNSTIREIKIGNNV